MTELSIRPDEIRDALQRFVSDYKPETAGREEVGTVAETADGIARVSGLPSAMANELLEFEDGTLGIALNLDTREIGVVVLGDFEKIEEGQAVRRTGEILSVPVGDAYLGRVVDPLGEPDRRPRRDRDLRAPRARAPGGRRDGPQVGPRAAGDRHQGHRRAHPDRPRTAPADHRRPRDRQDHRRDRHDHQPEAELGDRRPRQAGPLHLRRHRPEGLDHRRGARRPRGGRRAGVHHHRRLARRRTPPASSTSRPTPARPSASTGCTTASTS